MGEGSSRRRRRVGCLLLSALLVACTTGRMPRGLDAAGLNFHASSEPGLVNIAGAANKGQGARAGAVAGGGPGLLLGGLLCMAAGPLAALCAGPALAITAAGAAGGAAIGAVTSESAVAVEAKHALLAHALANCACAEHLTSSLRDGTRSDAPPANRWWAEVRIVELATVGGGPGHPFGLRLLARLEIARAAGEVPLLVKDYGATGGQPLPVDEWQRDGAARLSAALEEAVQSLSEQMLKDLQAPH